MEKLCSKLGRDWCINDVAVLSTGRRTDTGLVTIGPPIPVYRILGYRRKHGRYWYRFCTV